MEPPPVGAYAEVCVADKIVNSQGYTIINLYVGQKLNVVGVQNRDDDRWYMVAFNVNGDSSAFFSSKSGEFQSNYYLGNGGSTVLPTLPSNSARLKLNGCN